MLNRTFIEATSLEDAWYQLLYKCLEMKDYKIDRGSFEGQRRLEFDWIDVHIKRPWTTPLLPTIPESLSIPPPADENYLNEYVTYLMTGEKKENESYTYGERLNQYLVINSRENIEYRDFYFSQVDRIIYCYKNHGHRNNQMILQIAQPEDILLEDPPCCRHIDTRIQDNKLHFFPYFRSWDLFNGFPVNLAGIEILKQYMASEIGVENGEMIATSKGLHLYDYNWEIVECLRGKTIEEFRKGL